MAMEVEEQIRHIHVFLCTCIYIYIYIIYIIHAQNLPMPLNRHVYSSHEAQLVQP